MMMKKICALTLAILFVICNSSFVFAAKPEPPVLIKRVNPSYPVDALAQGIEGKVVLRVFLSDKGIVEKIEIGQSAGHASLDQAAIDAVKQWEFSPASKDGKACRVIISLPVEFRLSKDNTQVSPKEANANAGENSDSSLFKAISEFVNSMAGNRAAE